jgi:hypothetical protein
VSARTAELLCTTLCLNSLPPHAVTFSIYDIESTGRITPANLSALLTDVMAPYVSVTPTQVGALVAHTFAQEDQNRDGVIDFAEYAAMISRAPGTLKFLTCSSIAVDYKRNLRHLPCCVQHHGE